MNIFLKKKKDSQVLQIILWTVILIVSVGSIKAEEVKHSSVKFLPDGRPSSLVIGGKECLNSDDPGDGFILRVFDGIQVHEETLSNVTRTGEKLTVTNGDGIPRFTFRVVEAPRHVSFHLIRVEGMPKDRGVSLGFNARVIGSVEVVELDYMVKVTGKQENLVVSWPYLWNNNPEDPLGAFALYEADNDNNADRSLAEIWATEPLPRPAGQESWTEAKVMEWVQGYKERFSNLSEITLSASSQEELYTLTEQARKANIRRIYLHCDTWRGEYWPRYRTHVDVNPEVFPNGRSDLVKYADYLHKNGMLLRLHNVSGGIGWHDPKRIVAGVDRGLASWGGGKLNEKITASETELHFIPDPGTMVPIHDKKNTRLFQNMAVDYVRIGEEIIRVNQFTDLDQPVWKLLGCERGCGGTEPIAHDAGVEGEGLYVPYRSNLIADLNSPLLKEMAAEYAALVNEAKLDHLHFDGLEIHAHEPWGRDKFSSLVYRLVNHMTTSSTSGGRPITANFEMRFSAIRDMHELDYHGVLVPMLLAEHREATSILDDHFCIQSMLQLGTRRLVLQKPEPMFGINSEILEQHGLTQQVFKLASQWIGLLPKFGSTEAELLSKYMSRNSSALGQGASHFQSPDVLVLEQKGTDYYWISTRVMVRESGDVPWRFGQEHGAIGPRQYMRPGETLQLINPYEAQSPGFIINVLPECVEMDAKSVKMVSSGKQGIEDEYAAGAERAGKKVSTQNPFAGSRLNQQILQPLASEVTDQRFATYKQDGEGVIISGENPTGKAIWVEEGLPEWKRSVKMAGRGLAMEITGDGSGAVLVIQLDGSGIRDYIVTINFSGKKEIIIPNGEVAWVDGNWGYRIRSKKFDYGEPISLVRMGFGYIPPKTHPQIRIANLRLLQDKPARLFNPVIRVGDGSMQVSGSIQTGDYLKYQGGEHVQVYDENWNHKADLPVKLHQFEMPNGEASVKIEVAKGKPRPWISAQFITKGKPIPLP